MSVYSKGKCGFPATSRLKSQCFGDFALLKNFGGCDREEKNHGLDGIRPIRGVGLEVKANLALEGAAEGGPVLPGLGQDLTEAVAKRIREAACSGS